MSKPNQLLEILEISEFDDLDLLNYILYTKLTRSELYIILAYAECNCKYSKTAIKLRSSVDMVSKSVKEIVSHIKKEFKIAKQYYDVP